MTESINRRWLAIAGLSGALAVTAGAFGAHGLEGAVPERDLAAFKTGAHYHLIHSAVLLGLALAHGARPRLIDYAGWVILAGIVLFSGSLYVLGVTGSRALVLVTPLGGLCFILGWGLMAYSGLVRRRT